MDQSQIQTEQTQHTVSTTDMSTEEFLSLARNHTCLPTQGFPPEDGGPKYRPPATYMVESDTPEEESTSESPHQTQVSTTARSPPTVLSTAAAALALMSYTPPKQTPGFQRVRKTSSGQALSGDAPSGRKGGSAPPEKGTASKKSFYNRFSSLPLITLDAAESPSTTNEDDTHIPEILQRIKEKPKRKWKHSKLFPKDTRQVSSDSAEELLASATKKQCQESPKMSKNPTGWTAKEWAQILGVKWPIKDLNNMEFLPTETSASHMHAGNMKKKSSSKSFSAEEWAKILGVDIKDYLPGAKCCAQISEWKEPKPKKPIEPFDTESFIRTGRAMTEDQKRTLIQKAVQGKDDFLNSISPASWARLLEVKSVFRTKYKSLQVPTLLQSLQGQAERQVLVNSGATDNFISSKLLKRMKIGTLDLKHQKVIWNINSTQNKSGMITRYADLQVQCGNKTEVMQFLVTNLGEDEIVLGYPWLAVFQPKIDWKDAVLDEDMQPLVIKTLGLNSDEEVVKIRTAWCKKAAALATPGEEIFLHHFEEAKLWKTSTVAELAVKALPKEEKTWDQIVPPQYHKWKNVTVGWP
jgi:hypothetical protein